MKRHDDTPPETDAHSHSNHDTPVLADGAGDSRSTPWNRDSLSTAGFVDGDSLNRLFDVLSHPYRRRVLLWLDEHALRSQNELQLDDLAVDGLTVAELHHVHLPKLADMNYVEWDASTNTLSRGAKFDEALPLLSLVYDLPY